jgi:hypothetical protein
VEAEVFPEADRGVEVEVAEDNFLGQKAPLIFEFQRLHDTHSLFFVSSCLRVNSFAFKIS